MCVCRVNIRVRLKLKYRPFKHAGLMERNIRDALSPELEKVIQENERATTAAGLTFPTGDELMEKGSETATKAVSASEPAGKPHDQSTPTVTRQKPVSVVQAEQQLPEREPVAEKPETQNHNTVTAHVTEERKDNVVSLRPRTTERGSDVEYTACSIPRHDNVSTCC
jgi:hypothetical protein